MYMKERIKAGQCLLGACVYSNSPEVIEYSTDSMDWIWWEAQHTHSDWQNTVHGVRTANWIGVPVLIRSWTHNEDTIEKLLDTGAEGIIVPMVNTPEQAEQIVSRCYYPPVGNRSFGSVRMEMIERDVNEWNKRIVTIMQIETPEAVENAEAIANVTGVDALHVGTRDLALRLGTDVDDYTAISAVEPHLDHVANACRKSGKAAAVIAFTQQSLRECVVKGYRLVCAGVDIEHVARSHREMREAFDDVTRQSAGP